MFKQIIHLAAAGSVGLMMSGQAATAGIFKKCDDERTQVSPACHPTFGYHQTCWRRFPPLPPCDSNCESCQDGTCMDGSCQTPIYQPQPMIPMAQPGPAFTPDIHSGRYQSGHSSVPVPMPGGPAIMNSPGAFPMESSQPGFGGNSASSRYGQTPATTGNTNPTPLSPIMPTPPGAQPNHSAPPALPPVPSPANQQSSRLFLPSQPQAVSGTGRYGMSTRRQATQPVSRSVVAPMPQRPQTAARNSRYRSVGRSVQRMPNMPAAPARIRATTTQLTQPVATPLLKLPAN